VLWNDSPTPMSTLQSQFDVEGERTFEEQPTIEVDTDKDAEYETLAKVLARAKNAGLTKISFVQPDAE
jgi:biopolymer transport protein ExbD